MMDRVFLGRYQTTRLLGQGGMGSVFLARLLHKPKELVVVKVMHEHIATNPKFRERFQHEIDSMARFQHPHSVRFIEGSLEDPQGPCLVMEYVPGDTLAQMLSRNVSFRPMRLLRIVAQLCEVLQAAHDLGIIHRDLKPANLLIIDPDTPFENLKVTDFGLAHMIDMPVRPGAPAALPVEYAVGTPGYMSPEQVRGEAVDPRGDLYSVGVILYQLLSGRLPFSGPSTMEILMAQATGDPPTFASLGVADRIPAEVESVVRACLAAEPKARPASARELAQQFERALTQSYSHLEEAAPPAPAATTVQEPLDPFAPTIEGDALIMRLEAWMPEQIAKYKLRGFAEAVGGEMTHIGSGVLRMRLRGARTRSGWLGLSRKSGFVDVELHLKPKDPGQPTLLDVTVYMRPASGGKLPTNPDWHEHCQKIMVTLRAYLMSP
jgi:serine/threonine-protein kinase